MLLGVSGCRWILLDAVRCHCMLLDPTGNSIVEVCTWFVYVAVWSVSFCSSSILGQLSPAFCSTPRCLAGQNKYASWFAVLQQSIHCTFTIHPLLHALMHVGMSMPNHLIIIGRFSPVFRKGYSGVHDLLMLQAAVFRKQFLFFSFFVAN